MAQPTPSHAARTETAAPAAGARRENGAHTDTGVRHETAAVRPGRSKVRVHSGQGRLAENIVVFVICFAFLCGALVLFSLWTPNADTMPLFIVGLCCYVVAFIVPLWLLSSKTARTAKTGFGTTME